MATEPTFDELKTVYEERRNLLGRLKTQALLEQPADKIYTIAVQGRALRYQRWKHGDANHWSRFLKAHGKTDTFTDEERVEFKAIQLELIEASILDKDLWREFLSDPANQKELDAIWLRMMFDSMMTKPFSKDLEDFLASDYGYMYGYFWFIIQGKLPHEIGEMPDSSVHAVNSWLALWAAKVIHK